MKGRQLIGYLLILGLLIISAAPPATPRAFPVGGKRLTNAPRDNLPSTQQSESSIDPFTVHPANRYDSELSGSYEEEATNGELQWKGFINDSASMYRYRETATVDDTVAIRWRMNATADHVLTNQTDYAWFYGESGADGWAWEEDAQETNWNAEGGGVISFPGGGIVRATIPTNYDGISWDLPTASISSTIWNDYELRVRADASHTLYLGIYDGGAFQTEDSISVTTSWHTFSRSMPSATFDELRFWNKDVWTGWIEIDYFRLYRNDEYMGDFQVSLAGMNATTFEGTGNTTLNAYQWNSSYYTIRPTITTEDGDHWRSWNLESNYQDLYQMWGEIGPDGADWLEGYDELGMSGLPSETIERGYYFGMCAAGSYENLQSMSHDIVIDPSDYTFFQLKTRSNDSTMKVQLRLSTDGGSTYNIIGTETSLATTAWTTISWNISEDTDWSNADFSGADWLFRLRWDEDDGTLDGNEGIWIDHIRILTTNDSSDLQFYELENYYRAEIPYNLRRSELEFIVYDDSEDELAAENIGDWSIRDYFDADELIPDALMAEVGDIDYLFGARTAGANTTIYWDYYEAEFAPFYWKQSSTAGTVESSSALGLYKNFTDSGLATVEILYNLVVPNFDAASGRFTIQELANTSHIFGRLELIVFSVYPNNGTLFQEILVRCIASNAIGEQSYQLEIANYPHGGTTADLDLLADASDGRTGWGEITWSIFYDKHSEKISVRAESLDSSSEQVILFLEEDTTSVAASSEFVLQLKYYTDNNAAGTAGEILMQVSEFSLTQRDILGIPLDVPDIDVPDSSSFLEILLQPLIGILNVLDRVREISLRIVDNLVSIALTLIHIETTVNNIFTYVNNIDTLLTTLDTVVDNVFAAVDGVEGLLTGIDSILGNISSYVDNLEGYLDQLEGYLDNVEGYLNDVEGFLSDIETAVQNIPDMVLDIDTYLNFLGWIDDIWGVIQTIVVDIVDEWIADIISQVWDIADSLAGSVVSEVRGWGFGEGEITIGEMIDLFDSFLEGLWDGAGGAVSFLNHYLSNYFGVSMILLFGFVWGLPALLARSPDQYAEFVHSFFSINVNPFTILGFDVRIPLGLIPTCYVLFYLLDLSVLGPGGF